MKKAILIIAIVAFGMMFQGCYTVIAKKKLSKKTWLKYHKREFFYNTNWGREWNYYYYDPHLGKKSHEKKVNKGKNANIHEHEISTVESAVNRLCRYGYTDCSCIFPDCFCSESEDIEEEHNSDRDSTEVLPPEKPKKRRGL